MILNSNNAALKWNESDTGEFFRQAKYSHNHNIVLPTVKWLDQSNET